MLPSSGFWASFLFQHHPTPQRAQRNPMRLLTNVGAASRANVNAPDCVPLFQAPPRRKPRVAAVLPPKRWSLVVRVLPQNRSVVVQGVQPLQLFLMGWLSLVTWSVHSQTLPPKSQMAKNPARQRRAGLYPSCAHAYADTRIHSHWVRTTCCVNAQCGAPTLQRTHREIFP